MNEWRWFCFGRDWNLFKVPEHESSQKGWNPHSPHHRANTLKTRQPYQEGTQQTSICLWHYQHVEGWVAVSMLAFRDYGTLDTEPNWYLLQPIIDYTLANKEESPEQSNITSRARTQTLLLRAMLARWSSLRNSITHSWNWVSTTNLMKTTLLIM